MRCDRWAIYDYFEGTLEADLARYPATDQLRSWMAAVGFRRSETFAAHHFATKMPAREALESGRLDSHMTSQLALLTKAAYEPGIERLWQDVRASEERGETWMIEANLTVYATVGWA